MSWFSRRDTRPPTQLPTLPSASPETHKPQSQLEGLAAVKNVIAISSGKGGVGKSTVAVNLASAIAATGSKVGLMDADVYGPSIPKMLSGRERPGTQDGKILPVSRYDLKFMSLGLLTDEDTPVIWRGPMATKLVQQFLGDVLWGDLDYLLIDLPPGTGDVALTLTQSAPLTGAVIVTTPQEVAVSVVVRGVRMFEEVRVPILGLVENMSGFVCPHCHRETPIFRQGGGRKAAEDLGLRYLGGIPIDPALALAGDSGTPVVTLSGDARPVSARAFEEIAKALLAEVAFVRRETESLGGQVREITNDEKDVIIRWQDRTARYPFRALRLDCLCARCVDEKTGEKQLNEGDVPMDVHPLGFKPVGRYGLQILWSDGHNTGIYTFSRLREMAPR